MKNILSAVILSCLAAMAIISCQVQTQQQTVATGSDQLDVLLPLIKGKKVALVVNHTSLVGNTHLADSLKSLKVEIQKIFAPEHGFRGDAPDGENIDASVDKKTNIPVVSIYGKNFKPTPEQLQDVDMVIFDIQDVGARFYTYISTLHYVMEACADAKKQVIVLDRPNPNAGYVDGPIRESALQSFVGLDPLPIVYGLTIGELATMINGEGWLGKGKKCKLKVVPLKNWKHGDAYSLPARPSPNLPNDQAILLYPSLCLLEGTVISVGRGTQIPFLIAGNPELKSMPFQFTPVSIPGMSTHPPQENKVCFGIDLRTTLAERKLDLKYVLDFYKAYPDTAKFFISSFDRLAGVYSLKKQIKQGLSEQQIRDSWQPDLNNFKERRKKYLLYR